ncbi:hypothetical protein [Rhodanobacter sp. L36]|uniref:hypothetical protein n=1 Tax=Rhodanobacter sp. L36 TaxID=1747221 RepID=UPI00131E8EDC|nr:hypothetical protein [Rhodanobacter sp. L36]
MGFARVDEEKAQTIANRLAQIVANGDGHWHGDRVRLALTENLPNAATVTDALLRYSGNDFTNDLTRERVRSLLTAYRDQLMTIELMECEENLASSNERLGKNMLFAAWAGVAVAVVGVIAAIITLLHT